MGIPCYVLLTLSYCHSTCSAMMAQKEPCPAAPAVQVPTKRFTNYILTPHRFAPRHVPRRGRRGCACAKSSANQRASCSSRSQCAAGRAGSGCGRPNDSDSVARMARAACAAGSPPAQQRPLGQKRFCVSSRGAPALSLSKTLGELPVPR